MFLEAFPVEVSMPSAALRHVMSVALFPCNGVVSLVTLKLEGFINFDSRVMQLICSPSGKNFEACQCLSQIFFGMSVLSIPVIKPSNFTSW